MGDPPALWKSDPSHRLQIRQQSFALSPDNAIALARAFFESSSVQHLNSAMAVTDQPGVLQFHRRFRHAGSPDAEHVGDQLLRHRQFIRRQPVDAKKQPPTQLLVN